jgi:HlyD family secretion protein
MRALDRKLYRDLRRLWAQALAIALVIAGGVATLVSALGIEEQRVRTTIDLAEPSDTWSRLGHDYRVIVHVLTWSADDVLTVPVGALFRTGSEWAVYAVKDGRARTNVVRIGHRNAQMAEVKSGLAAGDRVVLHPSDRVRDGSAVARRDTR